MCYGRKERQAMGITSKALRSNADLGW